MTTSTAPKDESAAQLRFDIALSFAGDGKRDKLRRVAEILQQRLGAGRVFFDEWFEHELAGQDAQVVLQTIYAKRTWLVVTCVCRRYAEKPWTQDEWRAIQAFERTLRDAGGGNTKRLRFLPLRFGDGEVDGLFDTAIVPDVRERTPEGIAELILLRLEASRTAPDSPPSVPSAEVRSVLGLRPKATVGNQVGEIQANLVRDRFRFNAAGWGTGIAAVLALLVLVVRFAPRVHERAVAPTVDVRKSAEPLATNTASAVTSSAPTSLPGIVSVATPRAPTTVPERKREATRPLTLPQPSAHPATSASGCHLEKPNFPSDTSSRKTEAILDSMCQDKCDDVCAQRRIAIVKKASFEATCVCN